MDAGVRPGYVRIVNAKKPDEWLILHASDFDPAKHKLWTEPAGTAPAPGAEGGPTESVGARPEAASSSPPPEAGRPGNVLDPYIPTITKGGRGRRAK